MPHGRGVTWHGYRTIPHWTQWSKRPGDGTTIFRALRWLPKKPAATEGSRRPMKLLIAIPALNEEDSIESIIQRSLEARDYIRRHSPVEEVEITVVSDG